ncbi:NAD(P)H-dependent glycerol-3-phosphate dehydrogenase [uncultured Paenalcaligenes sp.]|uniref:NAD(P)H-dependent glycerol-3-phosphate dehydrogenase n=1 Tax=uncultured Paenalcaligenes sp. TaxID=1588925 RepID=UPI0026146636|nr:NAD(P)H-dependent glycerol-3-phosphate dehydrogenase [uncultured Paenalcaligenes sp.]
MPQALSTVPVLVLGAGSWGTALAALACQRASTLVWARNADSAAEINTAHQLQHYLPQVDLPNALTATHDFAAAMQHVLGDDSGPGLIILGVPLAGLTDMCAQITAHLPKNRKHPLHILRTCKGFEPTTTQLPHQLTDQHLPRYDWLHTGTLSGPSFALEVAQGLPVALTVASHSKALAQCTVDVLHGQSARIYSSTDIMGVEIGGALKNIIAIACGASDGLHLGTNARAALITRGLAEIQRIGMALGGDAATFSGLTGLGDLVLTTTGDLSRNRQVGLAIAKGIPLDQILASGLTAEGVRCAQAALTLAEHHQIDAPITQAVCDVLFHDLPPLEAVQQLLRRVARLENSTY